MTLRTLNLSLALLVASSAMAGCSAMSLAASAAGAAISVTGAVISTGVTVTGKAVGAGIDALSSKPVAEEATRQGARTGTARAAGAAGEAPATVVSPPAGTR